MMTKLANLYVEKIINSDNHVGVFVCAVITGIIGIITFIRPFVVSEASNIFIYSLNVSYLFGLVFNSLWLLFVIRYFTLDPNINVLRAYIIMTIAGYFYINLTFIVVFMLWAIYLVIKTMSSIAGNLIAYMRAKTKDVLKNPIIEILIEKINKYE